MGKMDSSMCSFCGTVHESLEHLFVLCSVITTFWSDLILWCRSLNVKIEALGLLDILSGLWRRKEDYLLKDQVIIIAKQYLFIYLFICVCVCVCVFVMLVMF